MITGMVLAAMLLLVAGFAITQPSATAQEAGATDATVRLVHALPGGPPVDVTVDGAPVATGLAFGAATEYAALPAGDHQVQVLPSGETTALIDTTVTAEAGKAYIVAVLGTATAPEAQVLDVNLDQTTQGQARIRLLNAVPDAGELNVGIAGGDNLFENVAFKATSDYRDGAPGTYDMAVSLPDSAEPIVTVPGVSFTQGTVYDIVALGEVGGGTVTLLPLATTVSQPCSMILGVGSEQDACVRFVHAAAGSAEVDIYVGGQVSAPLVSFGTSTNFVNLPAGDQQIQVTAAAAALDTAYLDSTQTLEAGQAYDVYIAGASDDLQVMVNQVDLTPLPVGQSRLRVVHTALNAGAVDVGVANGANLVEGLAENSSSEYLTVDAGTIQAQVRAEGEQTPLIESSLQVQEGMVYDVVAIGNASDASFQLLVLMTSATARQGEIATPVGSPVTDTGAAPVVGTPVPVEAPASPVTEAQIATPVGATSVAATPVTGEGATDAVEGAVTETTDQVEGALTETPAA